MHIKGDYHVQTLDMTWRTDRNGNTILTKGGEHVVNVAQFLFNLRPGTDEYDRDKGLFIREKYHQPMGKNVRDSEYESRIVAQFTKYTDLLPLTVIATYINDAFRIYMQIRYQDEIYELEMEESMDTLTAVLRNQ